MALKITPDVLSNIFENLGIEDVKNVVQVVTGKDSDDARQYVRDRQNPMVYLRKLTEYPEKLLVAMDYCGVLLFGSRAADYFYPGLAMEDSGWDFIVHENLPTVLRFLHYMEMLGTTWSEKGGVTEQELSGTRPTVVICGSVLTKGVTQRVRLTLSCRDPFSYVLTCHSSIVQCFISPVGAASLYHTLGCKGRSVGWDRSYNTDCPADERDRGTLSKQEYRQRGVTYVWDTDLHSVSDFVCLPLDWNRTLSDADALLVPFSDYYTDTAFKAGIERRFDSLVNLAWCSHTYTANIRAQNNEVTCLTACTPAIISKTFQYNVHVDDSTFESFGYSDKQLRFLRRLRVLLPWFSRRVLCVITYYYWDDERTCGKVPFARSKFGELTQW